MLYIQKKKSMLATMKFLAWLKKILCWDTPNMSPHLSFCSKSFCGIVCVGSDSKVFLSSDRSTSGGNAASHTS